MRHYKDDSGKVYAFESDDQMQKFAKGHLTAITDTEKDALLISPKTVEQLVASIEQQRKAAERQGVTINGLRYAGDESNRQALSEAIQFAEDAGETTFAGWKDSDGGFHADHPVADVKSAYRAIGARRSALIALEGQYVAQVMDGTLTDVDGLNWSVDY